MAMSRRSSPANGSTARPSSRAWSSVATDVATQRRSSSPRAASAGSRWATVEPVPSPTRWPGCDQLGGGLGGDALLVVIAHSMTCARVTAAPARGIIMGHGSERHDRWRASAAVAADPDRRALLRRDREARRRLAEPRPVVGRARRLPAAVLRAPGRRSAASTSSDHLTRNGIAGAIYLPLAMVIGTVVGQAPEPDAHGVGDARAATRRPRSRRRCCTRPNYCFKMDAAHVARRRRRVRRRQRADVAGRLAAHVGWTLFLGGMTTCGIAYLLLERDWRPVTELALAAGRRRAPPGRASRAGWCWPGCSPPASRCSA